jgi:hypothetical protein
MGCVGYSKKQRRESLPYNNMNAHSANTWQPKPRPCNNEFSRLCSSAAAAIKYMTIEARMWLRATCTMSDPEQQPTTGLQTDVSESRNYWGATIDERIISKCST